jgi:integrase/recombinase XerD
VSRRIIILIENTMTPHEKRPCPITIRLAEDMRIRNLAHRTIDAYTYHVSCFADFIQKPLDCAIPEDIRSFQLYLIDTRKLAYSSFNQAVCALRYLYTHTIRVSWPVTMVPFGKRPKTLPVVLGRHEVNELLACTKNLKQRTFITTLYATGMRFSEAAHLLIHDIDSQRMQIRITNGKGAKQRQVPLSPRLLSELRAYWRHYKPTLLLFFGKTHETTYCDTSIQKAIKASARLAGINKNVTPHTFRHSYATGLLEAGVDLLTISRLLGHASFATTMIYLHCRREHMISIPSPLDWLPVKQLPTYRPPADNGPTDNGPTDNGPAENGPAENGPDDNPLQPTTN